MKVISKNRNLITVAFLIIIVFVVYIPSLYNGFCNWDDPHNITRNFDIRGLTPDYLHRIFTHFVRANYHPITTLSHALEFQFFRLDPFYYHLNNLILHVLTTLLVYWFIFLIKKDWWVAFIVAVLFGVHPMHVESVAWATERKDVLFGVFYVAAMISHVYFIYSNQKIKKYFWFTGLFFVLSVFSKPTAVTLPIVLLLLDLYFGRKVHWHLIWEKIYFFIISLAVGLIHIYGAYSTIIIGRNAYYSLLERFLLANYTFLTYILKQIWPYILSCLYPYPQKVNALFPLKYYLLPAVTIGLIVYLIWNRSKFKETIFGFIFYAVTISIMLQFFSVGEAFLADRFIYIPSIGIFLIEAVLYLKVLSWSSQRMPTALVWLKILGVTYVLILSVISFDRCKVWKDDITLWTDVLKKFPDEAIAYNNRGLALLDLNLDDQAFEDFTKAVQCNIYHYEAYNNRGIVLVKKKRYQEAMREYDIATTLWPKDAEAYYNKGRIYQLLNQPDKAMIEYNKALESGPGHVESYNNRALLLMDKGDYNGALQEYKKALYIDPYFAEIYTNVGILYERMGNLDEAIKAHSQSISLKPDYDNAYANRGVVWQQKGDLIKALEDFNLAIKLNPLNSNAYFNRGRIYYLKEDFEAALSDLEKALEIDPKFPDVYNLRANAYYRLKKMDKALAEINKAIEISPQYISAYSTRAMIYSFLFDFNNAIKDLTTALELSPTYYTAYLDRGIAWGALKNYEKSISDFKKYIEFNKNDYRPYYNLAICYKQLKQWDLSIENANKAIKLGYNAQVQIDEVNKLRQVK